MVMVPNINFEMMELAAVMVATTKTQISVSGAFWGIFEPHRRPVKKIYYLALLMISTCKRENLEKP